MFHSGYLLLKDSNRDDYEKLLNHLISRGVIERLLSRAYTDKLRGDHWDPTEDLVKDLYRLPNGPEFFKEHLKFLVQDPSKPPFGFGDYVGVAARNVESIEQLIPQTLIDADFEKFTDFCLYAGPFSMMELLSENKNYVIPDVKSEHSEINFFKNLIPNLEEKLALEMKWGCAIHANYPGRFLADELSKFSNKSLRKIAQACVASKTEKEGIELLLSSQLSSTSPDYDVQAKIKSILKVLPQEKIEEILKAHIYEAASTMMTMKAPEENPVAWEKLCDTNYGQYREFKNNLRFMTLFEIGPVFDMAPYFVSDIIRNTDPRHQDQLRMSFQK